MAHNVILSKASRYSVISLTMPADLDKRNVFIDQAAQIYKVMLRNPPQFTELMRS